jgi:hypothetical protein
MGGLLGDSLFAVTHYNGYAEAALPIATVALVLVAIARAVPRLTAACSVGFVVNVALTAPNTPPGYDGIVSAAAAALLAIMICRPAPITSPPRPYGSVAVPVTLAGRVTTIAVP